MYRCHKAIKPLMQAMCVPRAESPLLLYVSCRISLPKKSCLDRFLCSASHARATPDSDNQRYVGCSFGNIVVGHYPDWLRATCPQQLVLWLVIDPNYQTETL